MVKVIGMIENDPITGVKYGIVEANESVTEINRACDQFKKTRAARTTKVRGERTKKK